MSTIVDTLGDAVDETKALYLEHMKNGRYNDAIQCVQAMDRLTETVVSVENGNFQMDQELDQCQAAFEARLNRESSNSSIFSAVDYINDDDE